MRVAVVLSSCLMGAWAVNPGARKNQKVEVLPQINPRGNTKTGFQFYEETNGRKVFWDILHGLGVSKDVASQLVDGDNYILCDICVIHSKRKGGSPG